MQQLSRIFVFPASPCVIAAMSTITEKPERVTTVAVLEQDAQPARMSTVDENAVALVALKPLGTTASLPEMFEEATRQASGRA